jgi:outer membrane protein insertion porin family
MKNHILVGIVILLCAALAGAAESGVITSISFSGLVNVKEKILKKEISSKAGKPYSAEKVKADLQTIIGKGYFDEAGVSVDTGSYTVHFQVKEKPLIRKVTLFGNDHISQNTLLQDALIKKNEYFNQMNLDQAKEKIVTLYHDKGYEQGAVESSCVFDDTTNTVAITLQVTEGVRVVIDRVDVPGATAVKPKKVLGQLEHIKKKKVFKKEWLKRDVEKIATFYKNKGYMQAAIGEPVLTYNTDRTHVSITIPIKEGALFTISSISFAGNTIYSQDELRKSLAYKTGERYQEDQVKEYQQALLAMYSEKGHLSANITPTNFSDDERGVVAITFSITEGPVFYLGKTYIDGLTKTREFVIRRELVLKEGDVLASSKIRRSIEKIQNLGFIDSVEPEILATPKPAVVDLDFYVMEGKPGMVTAGAGYSSEDGLVGTLSLQHTNLFGRAQRASLSYEFGETKQNYDFSFTEPWFRDKPVSLGFRVFDTVKSRTYDGYSDAYKEADRGASLSAGPRLNDNLGLLFTYAYAENQIYDIYDSTYVTTYVTPAHDITSSIISQISWDTRDNIYYASRGSRQLLSVQLSGGALGGSVDVVKTIISSSLYIPTFWKFVLSLNGTMGLVENYGNSREVPLSQRFFIGGSNSVRGYTYGSIGRTSGARMMSVLNAEYSFPIAEEKKKKILTGAFFCDLGGSWDNAGDFTTEIGEEERQMKAGVGFGIRFTTPVFPLRLDWGYGLNHKENTDPSQFYFTIGSAF